MSFAPLIDAEMFPKTHQIALILDTLDGQMKALESDKARLDWLLSDAGSLWAYWRREHAEKVDRESIDLAMNPK